jgi:hypothetical protein
MFTLFMGLAKAAEKSIKAAMAEYKAKDGQVNQAYLSTIILRELGDWKPEHKGKQILTPSLRASFASALAGLAYNIAAADAGRPLA